MPQFIVECVNLIILLIVIQLIGSVLAYTKVELQWFLVLTENKDRTVWKEFTTDAKVKEERKLLRIFQNSYIKVL